MHLNEDSWAAWLTLHDALENDDSARDESTRALARAAALAPDDPQILVRLAYQALNRRLWPDAIRWFARAWVVSPDHTQLARVYLAALSHHEPCGAMVSTSAVRRDQEVPSPGEQDRLIRSVELCVSSSDGSRGQSAKTVGKSRPSGPR